MIVYNLMRKGVILIIFFSMFVGLNSNAQDVHFSQFQSTPLIHNPSFAGKSEGDLRAIVNYRSQWGSVTSSPYQSFGASYDMRFEGVEKGESYFAGGISMYSDVAGTSRMRTTLVNFTIAAHVKLNSRSYFSGGIQGGFNQRSMEVDDLRFDNQLDGTGHNPLIDSQESFSSMSEMSPTISGGISYIWSDGLAQSNTTQKPTMINVGLAVHHYNEPRYYAVVSEDIGMKMIASLNGYFGLSNPLWTVRPSAYFALQNKATDFVLGSLLNYKLNSIATSSEESMSIGFGAYFRFGDAIVPTVQLQWSSFILGMSYDANISNLNQISRGKGGFEISLKYIAKYLSLESKSRMGYM